MTRRYIIDTYPPIDALSGLDEVEGKFVQFSWEGTEHLLFATREQHRFHNQMLARFLAEHGIPHRWIDDQTLEIETDTLLVLGGGRFRYRQQQNLLELWDNSQAYGRFNETGIEAKIHAAGHPWSGARVSVS